jgi:hypothetical protein
MPQPKKLCQDEAEQGGNRHLRDGAGNGDPAHPHQVSRREMQADAEHEKDDADLGKLLGQYGIGDETRRMRPDGDASEQITDQRREPKFLRNHAEGKRDHEGQRQHRDKRCIMRHDETIL